MANNRCDIGAARTGTNDLPALAVLGANKKPRRGSRRGRERVAGSTGEGRQDCLTARGVLPEGE
jgi:hypothetical protein